MAGIKPLLETIGALLPKGRIRAYHGSGSDFDRFDLSKLQTGEGENAYGRGFYLAENENVARHYRDMLSDQRMKFGGQVDYANRKLVAAGVPPQMADEMLYLAYEGGYVPGGKESIKKFFSDTPHLLPFADNSMVRKTIDQYTTPPSGKMYEVDIRARPDQMLDLDNPMSKQSEAVRKAIGGSAKQRGKFIDDGNSIVEYQDRGNTLGQITKQHDVGDWKLATGYGGGLWQRYPSKEEAMAAMDRHFAAPQLTGEQAYGNLIKRFRGEEEDAQKFLADRDVLGLRYLDEHSRNIKGVGKRTSNYVIPDPNILDVVKKYSIGAGAALPFLGAYQPQGQQ